MIVHHTSEVCEKQNELATESGFPNRPSSDVESRSDQQSIQPAGHEPQQQIPGRASKTASRVSEDPRPTESNVLSQILSRITTREWPEPSPAPDGGIKAWTQVACGWLVVCTTWGYANSFGSFQTYYESDLLHTYPPSTISWIGAVQVWLTLFIGVFSGRLLDAGFFLPTFMVGACVQVLGMFLMSISTEYWQLMLTQGVLTGIGAGIFFTPSMALITTYFQKRRGISVGVATTGNSIGGMVYPLAVRELLPRLGFAWTTRILAFINLGALATACVFMRPRLPPRKSGPLIDTSALIDPVYMFLIIGMFGLMWGNYYTFYYVRLPLFRFCLYTITYHSFRVPVILSIGDHANMHSSTSRSPHMDATCSALITHQHLSYSSYSTA